LEDRRVLSRTIIMNPIKRTIRRKELVTKTGLSKTSIYNLEKEGKFPSHFMLTPRCAVWVESEVDDWLAERRAVPTAHAPFPDQSLRRSRPGRGAAV
jgi:prophage regulatory protein